MTQLSCIKAKETNGICPNLSQEGEEHPAFRLMLLGENQGVEEWDVFISRDKGGSLMWGEMQWGF